MMRQRFIATFCIACLAATAARATEPPLETEEQKTLYAIGLALSQKLAGFGMSEEELTVVQMGFVDGMLRHDPKITLEEFGPKIDPYLAERRKVLHAEEVEAGNAFRAAAAAEPGAVVAESGVVYFEQQAGTGDTPTLSNSVRIHYHGTFRDGRVFDTSRGDGEEPAEFALDVVVPCFGEGIRRMRVGGKSKIVCPPEQAYGDQGYGPMIPPGATLIFEVELLGIVDEPAAPALPQPTMP